MMQRVSFEDTRDYPWNTEMPPVNKKPATKTPRFPEPASFTNDDEDTEEYVEITLDIREDSVSVYGMQSPAFSGESPDRTLLRGDRQEKRPSVVDRLSSVSQELRRLTSFTGSRKPPRPPARPRIDRTKTAAAPALKGLKFISKADGGAGWEAVEKRFDRITASTSDGRLQRSKFDECIGMNSKEFALELFDALARKERIQRNSITKDELRVFWEKISDKSFDTRLEIFFDMVDKDADGRLKEKEVREIISLSASANKLPNIQKRADEYAALIMEELDPDNRGYIMIDSLELLLLQAPGQTARAGQNKNMSQALSQQLRPSQYNSRLRRWSRGTRYFVLDNWQRVWVVALWIGAMAGLFVYKYIQYQRRDAYEVMGVCVCLAKGAAETLKLNMALILLPVCRNTLTWLRNHTKLGVVVPFDDNLNFHKVIAVGISIGVGIHAISHLACDFPRLIHASEEKYEPMLQYFGEQPTSYWFFVNSVEGVTGIIMVLLMAIAFTLATPWFRRGKLSNIPGPLKRLTGYNAFWYSHHLFVIVYTLLVVHGIYLYLTKEWYKKTTWMYLVVPVILYTCERFTRALRSSIKAVGILKVSLYPGNVLALHMTKPPRFRYKSGQYMFVNCAKVSPFEWHPFSITSAPGDDHLSVHIRVLGDWTRQLKEVFSEVCREQPSGVSGLLKADYFQGIRDPPQRMGNPEFPRVMIDAPYGAPAQDYKKYEVVLLVGLGIGATPMISILKDIVNNIKAKDAIDRARAKGERVITLNPSRIKKDKFKTARAYFYWVTREQGSFDWFKNIMNEVAESDRNGVIELHNYCTSVYEEGDARSALIAMLQSLNHAKNGLDIVSETRVMSHFAKPNWRTVYKRIAIDHPHTKVGVFYCGAPALTKELRHLALDFSHKTTTKFEFHKENF